MGTRSSIAIENADGTVESVYCHWDGYLSHNGKILLDAYDTEAKIRALLKLGNISSLGSQLGEKHDFRANLDDTCTFYGRDRGETEQEAHKHANRIAWLRHEDQEYNYLYSGGAWHVACGKTGAQLLPLTPQLIEGDSE